MITAIDLFSGAGGMSLGAAMNGINTVTAVEIDKHAALTYSYNHPDTKVINTDIRAVDVNILHSKGDLRILFGGPPCQGFSTSNQKTRNAHNKLNWLFQEFLRIAKLWKPDWLVLENVAGLLETEKGFFFEEITKCLHDAGYKSSLWVLNATDFGVPQKRRRLFIIGSYFYKDLPSPKIINESPVTVWDAISDLPDLQNGSNFDDLPYKSYPVSRYAEVMRGKLESCGNHHVTRNAEQVIDRYRHVPQGGNWENIPPSLMANYKERTRCHTGIYRRLNANEPSVVIGNYRKNMLIHPTQDRGLSVREAARIQSFPDSYVFKGSIGFQQQQVGNAVPPLMAKAVFQSIVNFIS